VSLPSEVTIGESPKVFEVGMARRRLRRYMFCVVLHFLDQASLGVPPGIQKSIYLAKVHSRERSIPSITLPTAVRKYMICKNKKNRIIKQYDQFVDDGLYTRSATRTFIFQQLGPRAPLDQDSDENDS
jgi:hypothetical protein